MYIHISNTKNIFAHVEISQIDRPVYVLTRLHVAVTVGGDVCREQGAGREEEAGGCSEGGWLLT